MLGQTRHAERVARAAAFAGSASRGTYSTGLLLGCGAAAAAAGSADNEVGGEVAVQALAAGRHRVADVDAPCRELGYAERAEIVGLLNFASSVAVGEQIMPRACDLLSWPEITPAAACSP